MITNGFSISDYDWCVYLKKLGDDHLYLLLYVDDMLLISPNKEEIKKLKGRLSSIFQMKDLGAAQAPSETIPVQGGEQV